MNPDDLCFMSVRELGPLIERRKVSPVELVDAQLARIEALDPILRSYIHVDADRARAAAKSAAIEIAGGQYRGLLHGITVAHKDIIDVRGLPTTAASRILSEYVAAQDATVSAKLVAAGAITLGKLNLIEFASGSMGLYGVARNPWSLGAFPGGSSSGSGTATAAGLVTLATGTDTGGSIRNPSNLCRVAGLRPTYGRVSRYGCRPLSWSQDSIGPMGRSVYDIAVMLRAMAGSDVNDPTAANVPVPEFRDIDDGIKDLRIGVPREYFFDDLDPEVEASLDAALKQLTALGAELKAISMPFCRYASAPSWIIAYSESFAYHRKWFSERAHDYTPEFYLKITAAGMTSAVERIISQQIRQLITQEFADVMRDVDVILTPAGRGLAASTTRLTRPATPNADMTSTTRPSSLSGYPSLAVPVAPASDGTGIAMQLIGRPFDEATLFRTGSAYERAAGLLGQKPPSFPATIPPASNGAPISPDPNASLRPDWVMDMARLLRYDFVTEEDAMLIAPMLARVKDQLAEAQTNLKLDLEIPTRPAGRS